MALSAAGLLGVTSPAAACGFAWGGDEGTQTSGNATSNCGATTPYTVTSGAQAPADAYIGSSSVSYGTANLNVAVGERTVAGTQGSTTDGWNQAFGSYSLASTGVNGTGGAQALGVFATASANNAMALGTSATASVANSIALGANSLATTAAVPVTGGTIAGTAYTYAGSASGVVSLGTAGNERQVTNVAPGQVLGTSTDAVNGSQLYATNTAVGSLSTTVASLPSGTSPYFSVNDGGTALQAANAVSTGAIAIGPGATAG
ncbi:adhesin, partial [Paraburkholderia humisilvae]